LFWPLIFFFKRKILKKLKEEEEEEEENQGWLAKMGWSVHPIFGQGVAGATPTTSLGVAQPPPWPRGWSGHPQKAKKQKKNKKQKIGFWTFEGGPTTPKGLEVASATTYGWRWSSHPQKPKTFFFLLLGMGVVKTSHGGGSSHPLAKNGVVRPPPIFFLFLLI
jgi:hypothetical protein